MPTRFWHSALDLSLTQLCPIVVDRNSKSGVLCIVPNGGGISSTESLCCISQ